MESVVESWPAVALNNPPYDGGVALSGGMAVRTPGRGRMDIRYITEGGFPNSASHMQCTQCFNRRQKYGTAPKYGELGRAREPVIID